MNKGKCSDDEGEVRDSFVVRGVLNLRHSSPLRDFRPGQRVEKRFLKIRKCDRVLGSAAFCGLWGWRLFRGSPMLKLRILTPIASFTAVGENNTQRIEILSSKLKVHFPRETGAKRLKKEAKGKEREIKGRKRKEKISLESVVERVRRHRIA
jgi:hypothetical protein